MRDALRAVFLVLSVMMFFIAINGLFIGKRSAYDIVAVVVGCVFLLLVIFLPPSKPETLTTPKDPDW